MKFISVHIPKTGGGSFKEILKKIYASKVHFDYAENILPNNWQDFQVIHGHFHLCKYAWANIPCITWMRHPVERVISAYFYRNEHKPTSWSKNIRTFAERMRNTQSIFIGDSLDKLDLVLFTEEYQKSLKKFEDWAEVKINFPIPRRNKSKKAEVSVEDREFIAKLNKADIELYEEAKRRFG